MTTAEDELRKAAIKFAWPELAGQCTYETLPPASKKHVDAFMSLLNTELNKRERKGRIAAINDYLDTCLSVPEKPSLKNLAAFQDGQLKAARELEASLKDNI